jgi:hypothetical protein
MALPEGVINGAFAETAVVRLFPLLSLIFLITLTLQMIAFFGESLASSPDTAGCADAPPSGFHASIH